MDSCIRKQNNPHVSDNVLKGLVHASRVLLACFSDVFRAAACVNKLLLCRQQKQVFTLCAFSVETYRVCLL